jgi:Mrp family chromosome partitioning ATPase
MSLPAPCSTDRRRQRQPPHIERAPILPLRARKLYAEIMLEDGSRICRRMLVTSPGPQEGTTFTTLTLAQFVAAAGRRVLVIECDMRSPSFESILAVKRTAGLADVLRGTIAARNAVTTTTNPNFDVIVAGAAARDSTELLMSRHMSELLLWSQAYDLVLLDCPACNVLTDARGGSRACFVACDGGVRPSPMSPPARRDCVLPAARSWPWS